MYPSYPLGDVTSLLALKRFKVRLSLNINTQQVCVVCVDDHA